MNTIDPNTLSSLNLPALVSLHTAAIQRAEAAKAEAKLVQDEITARLQPAATSMFVRQKKHSGDVTFEADGVTLKASISKTVKWDSPKLMAIASTMDWDTAQRVFDISFSVPERTFTAIPDPELIAKLQDARTVKYGELNIKPIIKE